MPELPEVETVMRGLSPALKNRKITEVEVRSKSLRIPIPTAKLKKLIDRKIENLDRRAKYILIRFSGEDTLVSHLGMTGSFTIYTPAKHNEIKLDRHDHVIFTTDKNDKIIYRDPRRFGMIDVVKNEKLETYPALANLGCEPLGKNFTAQHLQKKLSTRHIAIKPAIMDQRVVVGVGNIYASEALFLSGINPQTPACEVNLEKLETLTTNIKDILSRAIKSGGSTLRDYRSAAGEMGYFQFQFSVYDRAGEACPACTCSLKRTGGIQRIVQAGRSTFYCPSKQK